MNTLQQMIERAARKKYGPQVNVKIDPERGCWLDGVPGEAIAGKTLRDLGKLLGVSTRTLSRATLARMLGVGAGVGFSHLLRRKGVPVRYDGRKLIAYRHEIEQWMRDVGYDRARAVAYHNRGAKAAATYRANGHVPPNRQRFERIPAATVPAAARRLAELADHYAMPPLLTRDMVADFIVNRGAAVLEGQKRRGA